MLAAGPPSCTPRHPPVQPARVYDRQTRTGGHM
jgi:hypothetical protein